MGSDRRTPAAAAAASAASVVGDDDLLREILLRLGFPSCLVRAALVSKRWLLHASDPAFLRRFRERNPPRPLGFCIGYEFVPLTQPPELAALSRRVVSSCDEAFAQRHLIIKHCRNGRLLAGSFYDGAFEDVLLAPLLAGNSAAVLPPNPLPGVYWDRFEEMFLPDDGGRDGIALVHLWMEERKVYAEVWVLGSGGWGFPATAGTEIELPYATPFLKEMLPPVHGKVFMVTTAGYALGLDLATATFFTLELPVGVRYNYMLSCAENSGLYLVSADGFWLSVWLHGMTGDGDGAGGWLLVDTFCVREACTRSAGHNQAWMPQDGDFLGVAAVGDNADFVFLDHAASGVVFYVHLRSRVVEKVYDQAQSDYGSLLDMSHIHIFPFMIWPPNFPALNGGHDQEQ